MSLFRIITYSAKIFAYMREYLKNSLTLNKQFQTGPQPLKGATKYHEKSKFKSFVRQRKSRLCQQRFQF